MDDLDRRKFLMRAAQASLGVGGLGAGVLACGPRRSRGRGLGDAEGDAGTRDAVDVGEEVSDAGEAFGGDVDAASRVLSKTPFTQIEGPQSVVLRFETPTKAPMDVRLEADGASGLQKQTSTSTQKVDFRWPPEAGEALDPEYPDKPGTYTVHEARFEGLKPGREFDWVVHLGGGSELSGRVRVPPPKGAPFRFDFLADTMFPNSPDVGTMLQSTDPDLVLHGGDIQYQSNPIDTFDGLFAVLSGVMADGAMHFAIGNHEREGRDEFPLFWERLFSREDEEGSPTNYHSFVYGGIHFVVLDSESEFEKGSSQFAWMQSELKRASMRPEVRYSVVVFHRPFFTFSSSSPDLSTRDLFHPIFRDRGVKLVLTGHNHCYERFAFEGVTYVVDGGGGALLYGTDESRQEVLMERPKDEDRRKSAHRSHGGLIADVGADGTMALERRTASGMTVDQFGVG